MNYHDFFLSELAHELPQTRKMLAVVPEDKYDWKPHEKSHSIGDLASHIAQLAGFGVSMAQDERYDFTMWKNMSLRTNAALLETFDALAAETVAAVTALPEDAFMGTWAMVAGEQVIASFPKWNALQNVYLHHLIHHRAQLGVYLRLLDIPVPGMYGPSADEQSS